MSRKLVLADREWLRKKYEDEGCTLQQIADEVECSFITVLRSMQRHGINARTAADYMAETHRKRREERHPQLNDAEWLQRRYEADGRTIQEIADEIGCASGSVVTAFRRHGIESRTSGVTRQIRGREVHSSIPQLNDPEWIRRRYYEEGATVAEVADELKCSSGAVLAAMCRHGIELRKRRRREQTRRVEELRSDAIPQLHDREWLTEEYVAKERKAKDIAEELGCTPWAVRAALGRFGILKYPHRPQTKRDTDLPVGHKRKQGYILVYRPDHVNATGRGYVSQHRLVVEEALGRYLTASEQVHHVNEKRGDNRLENLMVFPNFKAHRAFHDHPPAWVPRCECCGRPRPELLTGRPAGVPLIWVG